MRIRYRLARVIHQIGGLFDVVGKWLDASALEDLYTEWVRRKQAEVEAEGVVPALSSALAEAGWKRASDWTYEKGRWVIASSYGHGYDLWEDGYPNDGESFRDGSRFYGRFDLPEDAMLAQQHAACPRCDEGHDPMDHEESDHDAFLRSLPR